MPASSTEALKRKRVKTREIVREWKKKNPEKVREQKRRYRARRKDKTSMYDMARDALNRWEGKGNTHDRNEILQSLFRARIVLIDFRPTAKTPGRSKRNPERAREYKREWRRKNPDKVREYKREWRRKNPEKAREQERRRWDRRKDKRREVRNEDMYDPDEILRGLFPGCSITSSSSSITTATSNESAITYASTTTAADKSTSTTTASLPPPFPLRAVTLRSPPPQRALPSSTNTTTAAYKSTNTTTATLPASPPPQRRGRRLSYSSSSSDSDSEPDEGLVAELERMLAEPEDPVKRRLSEIRKNRKEAEENRVRRMQERRKTEKMITEIAAELDKMSFMLHDMGRWFQQFEREDKVEQATQFEYSRNVYITAELMNQLEHYL